MHVHVALIATGSHAREACRKWRLTRDAPGVLGGNLNLDDVDGFTAWCEERGLTALTVEPPLPP